MPKHRQISNAAVGVSIASLIPPEARDAEGDGISMLKPLTKQVDRLAELVLEFEDSLAAVEGDKRFSDQGRQEKAIELFQEFRDRIDGKEMAERVSLAEKELERLQHVADPPASDDPNAIQVASDIRAHVAGLGSDERRKFLSQHAGDREVAAAVLSAPSYLSGMSKVEMDAFRRRALDALHPGRSERIALLEQTMSGAMKARRNAERMIIARAGVRFDRKAQSWVPDKPVTAAAGLRGHPSLGRTIPGRTPA